MTDYSKATNFAAKDALLTGNPSKTILGTEINTEYDAIAVAVATKYDSTDLADQSTAETGTDNATIMTPLRVKQHIAANPSDETILTEVKTANYTAVSGERVPCDTATTGSFTLTLPASPVAGDKVSFIDYASNFNTANLVIGRAGENIFSTAEDLTITINNYNETLMYIDATQGWTVI